MGVKEEVILTSNVGKNAFSFLIETGGLTIAEGVAAAASNCTCVFGTGHITEGSYNHVIERRSGSYGDNRSIIMTPYKTAEKEIPHDPFSSDEIVTASKGTLAHELSHQLGADDHYCYLGFDSINTGNTIFCNNSNCFYCRKYDNEKKGSVTECLMMTGANFSNADLYCADCSETIQTYIRQHLQ